MMLIPVFHDPHEKRGFKPLILTRPLYLFKIGGQYLFQFFEPIFTGSKPVLLMPKNLEGLWKWRLNIVENIDTLINIKTIEKKKKILLIDGRLLPLQNTLNLLSSMVEEKEDALECRGEILARLLQAGAYEKILAGEYDRIGCRRRIHAESSLCYDSPRTLLEGAQSLIREFKGSRGFIQLGDEGVLVDKTVKIGREVVLDASKGPIIVDKDSIIGDYVIIRGPVLVGPQTEINPGTSIEASIIGDSSSISGRIKNSLLMGRNQVNYGTIIEYCIMGEYTVIDAGVEITGKPGSEAIVGDYSVVLASAVIKEATSIGPLTIVAGDVPHETHPTSYYSPRIGEKLLDRERIEYTLRNILYNYFGRLPSYHEVNLLSSLSK